MMTKICSLIFFCVLLDWVALAQNAPHTPVKIIFDTDMGSDCDDAGALALLHHYADQKEAEILATVYTSGKVPYGAGVVEAINIFFGRSDLPVGATHDDELGDPKDKMNAEKLAKDTVAFGNTIIHNQHAPLHTALSRNILAVQPDNSVVYVTVGHTKGLYDLLTSLPDSSSDLSGKQLLAKKLKRWVALGALGADNSQGNHTRDWNFFFNGTAPYTDYLVKNFPVPVYYVDGGKNVMTAKGLKNTPPGNIVRTAYRDWLWNVEQKTLDDQRPSWDLVTVYFAVKGPGDFFEAPKAGWLSFDVEKGCRWLAGEQGPVQYFVRQKPGTDTAFAEYLNQRLSEAP
jgi:hypothetical protein